MFPKEKKTIEIINKREIKGKKFNDEINNSYCPSFKILYFTPIHLKTLQQNRDYKLLLDQLFQFQYFHIFFFCSLKILQYKQNTNQNWSLHVLIAVLLSYCLNVSQSLVLAYFLRISSLLIFPFCGLYTWNI